MITFFQVLNSPSPPTRDASPEDLIRSTKGITLATAKVVAAGNSCNQDDVIAAANMGRQAITEMLTICKVIMSSHVMQCHVVSCNVMLCHAMSCNVM